MYRNQMFLFSSKEYSSYPSFPQSQYSQYYSSSYNSPYVSANSISPSAIPPSTYSLQESSHNISSQSTESLSGRCSSSVSSWAVSATCDMNTVTLLLEFFCNTYIYLNKSDFLVPNSSFSHDAAQGLGKRLEHPSSLKPSCSVFMSMQGLISCNDSTES